VADGGAATPEVSAKSERRGGGGALGRKSPLTAVQWPAVFEHEMPIDPSSMTRWRKRLGEAGAEAMLNAPIETGVAVKVGKSTQWSHLNIDTTVLTKAFSYLSGACLYARARERLVVHAR
jgi:hypothetical protein